MTMVNRNDKRMVKMVRTVTVDSTLAPLAGRDWRCQRNLQRNQLKSIFLWKLVSIFTDLCEQSTMTLVREAVIYVLAEFVR